MLGPLYGIYIKNIGGDVLDAGSAWAIFMIISGIGMMIMGKIQDKLKREKLFIIIGYCLQSFVFLCYIFVSNVAQLYIIQILLGISMTIQLPALNSFYTKYLDKGKYAFEWAAWEGMYFTISGIGAFIGGIIVKLYSFVYFFVIMFVLSLIGLAVAFQLKEKWI